MWTHDRCPVLFYFWLTGDMSMWPRSPVDSPRVLSLVDRSAIA